MSFRVTPEPEVRAPRLQMKGLGAPRSTVFGVIGRTQMDPYQRSLGGIVRETTGGKRLHAGEVHLVKNSMGNTDRHILGPPSKTHTPKEHYGQVPYPGVFQSQVGVMVS